MNLEEIADLIQNNCDWDSFVGFCMDIHNDIGFKSRSDNMLVSSMREKAFSHFCSIPLQHIDENGRDYKLFKSPIEYKSQQNIFRVRKPNDKNGKLFERGIVQKDDTSPIKMKNFYGSGEATIHSFLEECKYNSTCEFIILNQTNCFDFRVGLVKDEYARTRYYAQGDGIYADFEKDHIHFLDLSNINPVTLNNNIFLENSYTTIKLNCPMSYSLQSLLEAKFNLYMKISEEMKKIK
jgi:hypothetical protein